MVLEVKTIPQPEAILLAQTTITIATVPDRQVVITMVEATAVVVTAVVVAEDHLEVEVEDDNLNFC
jgi:hypothetical protein